MQILFWIFVGAIFWTYAGYPCFLMLLSALRRRRLISLPIRPSVTVIIAAYNEEKHIARKVNNTLEQDYPKELLEVIVASDCSTDRTHEIVGEFGERGVKLSVSPQRWGKTAAQNLAVEQATGEILVFTDATTILQPDTIAKLVKGFADPRVGCIDAPHRSVSAGGSIVGHGGRIYRDYEGRIKDLEARVNSLIGVTGCLYAVRRCLYEPIDPEVISDFIIASKVYSKGHISVSTHEVETQEIAHEGASKEFDMRVRIVIRSIHGLVREAKMLNPFRYGFFSFQLFSHKVLRYLVPEFLLGTLILSGILALSDVRWASFYGWLFAAQMAVYGAAFLGWLCLQLKIRVPLLHIPFYFAISNLAAFWGFLKYLGGERKVTWTTVR